MVANVQTPCWPGMLILLCLSIILTVCGYCIAGTSSSPGLTTTSTKSATPCLDLPEIVRLVGQAPGDDFLKAVSSAAPVIVSAETKDGFSIMCRFVDGKVQALSLTTPNTEDWANEFRSLGKVPGKEDDLNIDLGNEVSLMVIHAEKKLLAIVDAPESKPACFQFHGIKVLCNGSGTAFLKSVNQQQVKTKLTGELRIRNFPEDDLVQEFEFDHGELSGAALRFSKKMPTEQIEKTIRLSIPDFALGIGARTSGDTFVIRAQGELKVIWVERDDEISLQLEPAEPGSAELHKTNLELLKWLKTIVAGRVAPSQEDIKAKLGIIDSVLRAYPDNKGIDRKRVESTKEVLQRLLPRASSSTAPSKITPN